MLRQGWKLEVFIGVTNLLLGGFLCLSPWIFGFTSELGWHTSWMAGGTIVILAVFSIADLFEFLAITEFFEAEEWINFAIGLWLAACPWILQFHNDMSAMKVHVAVGLVIAVIAAVELWLVRHIPPHEAA